jgi:hypothetical protein
MGDNSCPVVTFPTQSGPEAASRLGVVNPRLMSAAHTGAVLLFVGGFARNRDGFSTSVQRNCGIPATVFKDLTVETT